MSRSGTWFAVSFCLVAFCSGSVWAQDGRGSHGGSPRRAASAPSYYIPNTYPYQFQSLYGTGTPAQTAPVRTTTAQPAVIGMTLTPSSSPASTTKSDSTTPVSTSASTFAKISILAPEGAQVWFDGAKSENKEGARVFTTAPIESGQSTRVSVKIEWSGASREMHLVMQSGDTMTIDVRGSK